MQVQQVSSTVFKISTTSYLPYCVECILAGEPRKAIHAPVTSDSGHNSFYLSFVADMTTEEPPDSVTAVLTLITTEKGWSIEELQQSYTRIVNRLKEMAPEEAAKD